MNELTELVHNFNCRERYTKVYPYLGHKLDESLEEIEDFFYSKFWERRFKRRLKEEGLDYDPIQLCILQGTTSYLRDDTLFKIFDEDPNLDGVSDKGTMIALNNNMTPNELNDEHINNVVMHEFGHRQYNLSEYKVVIILNKITMGDPGSHIQKDLELTEKDYPYFTDHNELRQRIIPIIKDMIDYDWSAEDAYELSDNLKQDSITGIFTKKYIIHLLNNML